MNWEIDERDDERDEIDDDEIDDEIDVSVQDKEIYKLKGNIKHTWALGLPVKCRWATATTDNNIEFREWAQMISKV